MVVAHLRMSAESGSSGADPDEGTRQEREALGAPVRGEFAKPDAPEAGAPAEVEEELEEAPVDEVAEVPEIAEPPEMHLLTPVQAKHLTL